ncbi:MAG: response regulator [Alphaproteobacteria bacterium]|nr:response regulator [Alphaproteobacteria bacterium]
MAKILIVEDTAIIAMGLAQMVEELGHSVMGMAGNVKAAFKIMDASGPGPDLVMLDANLGGTSSAPIADRLEREGTPYIVSTGYNEEDLDPILARGARLSKPYRCRDLAQAFKNAGISAGPDGKPAAR